MAAPGNNCQYAVRLLVSYLRTKQFMTQPLHAAISLCHYNSFVSDYTCTININYIINCNLIYIYIHWIQCTLWLSSDILIHLADQGPTWEHPASWKHHPCQPCLGTCKLSHIALLCLLSSEDSTHLHTVIHPRLDDCKVNQLKKRLYLPTCPSFLRCFHFFWERFKLTPVNAEKLGHVYKVDQCKSQWMIYNYINYTITGQSCHNISYRISKSQIPKTHHDAAKEPLRRVNWPLRSSFGFLEAIWHNPQRFKALFRD